MSSQSGRSKQTVVLSPGKGGTASTLVPDAKPLATINTVAAAIPTEILLIFWDHENRMTSATVDSTTTSFT
jgi:hypothetical protein